MGEIPLPDSFDEKNSRGHFERPIKYVSMIS
jgi:hypothetical protein